MKSVKVRNLVWDDLWNTIHFVEDNLPFTTWATMWESINVKNDVWIAISTDIKGQIREKRET